MSSGETIGRALEEDLPTVRELLVEYGAWQQESSCVSGFQAELEQLAERYRDGALILARVDGKGAAVVGFSPLEAEKADLATMELRRLWVRPEFRGTGLGRRIVEACLAEARASAAESMVLVTTEGMADAVALYERMGFVDVPPFRRTQLKGARFMAMDLR